MAKAEMIENFDGLLTAFASEGIAGRATSFAALGAPEFDHLLLVGEGADPDTLRRTLDSYVDEASELSMPLHGSLAVFVFDKQVVAIGVDVGGVMFAREVVFKHPELVATSEGRSRVSVVEVER